jgi:GTP cyclohydrolase I/GTP cyclohydrolase-4
VGCPETCADPIDAAVLLRIVEESMSAEIYELMKRPDEADVVEKAHRRPRFVEDCVREAIRMAVAEYETLGPDAFVMSRQENLETIHHHNVVAERYGLIGELAGELDGGDQVLRHATMRDWLDGVVRASA